MQTRRQARIQRGQESQQSQEQYSLQKRKLKKAKNKKKTKQPKKDQGSLEKVKKKVKKHQASSKSPEQEKSPKPKIKRNKKERAKEVQTKDDKTQKNQKKDDQDSESQKENIKKVVVKGAAPVDEGFDKGKDYHVLVHQNKVYSATLNQSNIQNNNNKYYIVQILQNDSNSNKTYFFTKWGRIGKVAGTASEGPYTRDQAIVCYRNKYREKTKSGKYIEIQLNFGQDQDEKEEKKEQRSSQNNDNPQKDYEQSTLSKQVKNFVRLIFDIGMMNDQMKQIGYNVNKMPLGKLSKQNIERGYKVLQKLQKQLEKKNVNKNNLNDLSSEFFTYIPHDFGFQKMTNFVLDTIKKVKTKLQMLESLASIKIATQILGKKQDIGNKIDNNYKKLNRQIKNIEKDSYTFELINKYLQTTHGKTHSSYDLQLVDLFESVDTREEERFMKDVGNRMLLWHGSRLTNYVGILSQGLRIAPPQAPVTGYMFGKGVYFADMSSKSANYCFTNRTNNTGILILCDCALGEWNQKLQADYYAANLPQGKHSTKGVGRTAPKEQNFVELEGMKIPMGPGFDTNIPGAYLQYNEFIVYKIEQVRIKYILRTKFNYR